MNNKRIILLFYALGIVAIVAVIGVFASSQIESPAEAACELRHHPHLRFSCRLTSRVLSSNVVTRGRPASDYLSRFQLPLQL